MQGLLLALGTLLVACASPSLPAEQGRQAGPAGQARAGASATAKTVNVVLVGEPRVLSIWQEATTGGVGSLHEAFTGALISTDPNSNPIPRLAAEIPSVERGTWKVNPDGTMETLFKLQPNAIWHDGTPFTARDVVFSGRAQMDPKVDVNPTFAGGLRINGGSRVEALDDHTVVIHWSRPYGFADTLNFRDFAPLPAHVLEAVYERDVDEFNRHPYWTDDTVFIGSGPFRVVRWERGAHIDLEAFDRYYLGRPKVDRIIVHFVQDNNTAIARVLSGEMDMTWGVSWDKPGMDQVRGRGLGDFVIRSEGINHLAFQFKDVAQPIEMTTDVRLRRAMAHATDREAINEVDADGISAPADSWVHPSDPRFRDTEPYIRKYPYDPRAALALFAEAGWTRGSDGMLRNQVGALLPCELRVGERTRSTAVTVDGWRSVGIDGQIDERPSALDRDLAYRATYRCAEESFRSFGRSSVRQLHSQNAMIPQRNYRGSNRGAYMNPELDRLIDGWMEATRQSDRLQLDRELVRYISTELPILHTIYDMSKEYQKAGMTGLIIKTGLDPLNSRTWNAHEWDKQV
jgi:peptide/nickel transport system substrate-binding protein